MSQMNVKAAPGVKVPREDNPRRYITDAGMVTVEDTAYYLRQVMAGDLIVVSGTTGEKGMSAPDKATQEVKRVQS